MAGGRTIIQAIGVAVVLLISAQVEGQQGSVSPPIVAAVNGDQNITINCSIQYASGSEGLAWQYTPNWSHNRAITIYTSVDNSVKDSVNFTAVTSSYTLQGVQYTTADLTIKVANPGQAADYVCLVHRTLATVGASSFQVLDPIQCPAQDETEYTVGTLVNITCSVHTYNVDPALNEPIIDLIRIDQVTPLPRGNTTRNETTVTMTTSLVLAIEDDNTEYMCVVRFTNNMPEYNDNCTMIYYVLHEVTEIVFDPPSSSTNPTAVAVGDQINCTANGRPPPTIIWYNEQGEIVDEGEQLTVTPEMQSWPQPVTVLCIANNSIDGGVTYVWVEANYTFIVDDATQQVQSAGVEPWVIAVAVIVPIVVLAAIGIAIFFIIRHRKNNKNTKKKKTTTNGSATGNGATTASTAYSAVATQELSYSSPNRPPPSSAPRTNGAAVGGGGPPGPDSRNGAIRAGNSPGFGDLGVQTYGGSNQAVNAYPTRNSAHGSNQALGALAGVSMNPNPGYPRVASNQALNSSVSSSTTTRPNYPYQGSNSNINNTSLSMQHQNPAMVMGGPPANASYGRQPSIASSSGRSHASNYNSGQATDVNRFQNDLSSMHGSEV